MNLVNETRKLFGWTQVELADQLQVSRASVAKWASDERAMSFEFRLLLFVMALAEYHKRESAIMAFAELPSEPLQHEISTWADVSETPAAFHAAYVKDVVDTFFTKTDVLGMDKASFEEFMARNNEQLKFRAWHAYMVQHGLAELKKQFLAVFGTTNAVSYYQMIKGAKTL